MKPIVTLINPQSHKYVLETIYVLWERSKTDAPTPLDVEQVAREVPRPQLEKLFWDVLRQHIPIAEHIHFTFMLDGISVSLREQMVRHRIGTHVGDNFGVDIIPELASSSWWSQCFAGNTRVRLLDGTSPTLAELAADPNAERWVYSCDSHGRIVPGRAHAFQTIKQSSIVEVELDNGENIRCTPDHRWMRRDGTFVEAHKLLSGDSLMPLYNKLDNYGYELCYEPATNGWIYTHRRVYAELNGVSKPDEVIHHASFNKLNNDPRCLQRMDKVSHVRLHSDLVTERMRRDPAAHAQALSEAQLRRWDGLAEHARNSHREQLALARANIDSGQRDAAARLLMNQRWGDEEWRHKMMPILSSNGRSSQGRKQSADERARRSMAAKKRFQRNGAPAGFNHKVVAIRQLDEREDVYDLQVDDHHNFALAAGVFVHNSMRIQDMGSFADRSMYRVPETLAGVQATATESATSVFHDAMADIQAAYNKLVKAGVPMEDARELIPLGAQHSISWDINLQALLHVLGKRGCWILQHGIWGPIILGMVRELTSNVHPMFARIVAPPCIGPDNKFKACQYQLENERRITQEDRHPPCPLWLGRDEQGACHTGTGPGDELIQLRKQELLAANNTVPRQAEMRVRAEGYRELWGMDPYTWEK